jgi:hypothetical protein
MFALRVLFELILKIRIFNCHTAHAALFDHAVLNLHPLVNTATLSIKTEDFMKFLESLGKQVYRIDFSLYTVEKPEDT